jgi:hypothetical protein
MPKWFYLQTMIFGCQMPAVLFEAADVWDAGCRAVDF